MKTLSKGECEYRVVVENCFKGVISPRKAAELIATPSKRTPEDLAALKREIERNIAHLRALQKIHQHLTGREHRPEVEL